MVCVQAFYDTIWTHFPLKISCLSQLNTKWSLSQIRANCFPKRKFELPNLGPSKYTESGMATSILWCSLLVTCATAPQQPIPVPYSPHHTVAAMGSCKRAMPSLFLLLLLGAASGHFNLYLTRAEVLRTLGQWANIDGLHSHESWSTFVTPINLLCINIAKLWQFLLSLRFL